MTESSSDALYPIAVLIDDLKNEDIQQRLNSIRRLGTIALALGEERTRSELLAFLSENGDEEDEVLLALAEEMGNFVPYVGGQEHAHTILKTLEPLCNVEETVVRDAAVASVSKIIGMMKAANVEQYALPLVKRLSDGEWYSSRVAACGLIPPIHAELATSAATPSSGESDPSGSETSANNSKQEVVRALFSRLVKDETPMVRRAAANHIGHLSNASMDSVIVKTEIVPLFKTLTVDDQDSVRLLAVENCASVGKAMSKADAIGTLLPKLQELAGDKSWRVRYMVATQMSEISEIIGAELTKGSLLPCFLNLLNDNEAEVRIASAGKVVSIAALMPPSDAISQLLPCAKRLASDTNQNVRVALASCVTSLSPLLGKQATIESLLPLLLQLLKDEAPEVRLSIISNLDAVNQVVGIDLLLQSLLPSIVELAEDKHWRVRFAIIEYIPLLAQQLGQNIFHEKMGALCMEWLCDSVFSIREAAINNIKKLAEEFGVEWACTTIIPEILGLINNPNYLHRQTILRAIAALAPVVGSDVTCSKMLPVVMEASKDRVPNIRFCVAKIMQELMTARVIENSVVEQTIKPCLQELIEDSDADVRFFASQALEAC